MKKIFTGTLFSFISLMILIGCGNTKKSEPTPDDPSISAPIVTGVVNNGIYSSGVTINVVEESGVTYNAQIDSVTYNIGTFYNTTGNHTLSVVAQIPDTTLTASTNINFTIDPDAPDAPIITGVSNGAIYNYSVSASAVAVPGVSFTATLNDTAYTLGTSVDNTNTYDLTVTASKNNGLSNSTDITFYIDKITPTPGNSGTILNTTSTTQSITLSWTKGNDNMSPQSGLAYAVYYSPSNNVIDTLSNVLTNGTLFDEYATDNNTTTVTGLSENTTYNFNIIIKDLAGNESVYSMATFKTTDATAPAAPVVTGETITIDNTPTWDWADVPEATQYRYSFTDGSGWTITTNTEYTPASGLTDGTHTLYVQSGDEYDNWSSSSSFSTQIDTIAPSGYSVSFDSTAINADNQTSVTFTFTGAEVGAKYYYSIVGGSYQISSGGYNITSTTHQSVLNNVSTLDDGTLSLTAYLIDSAGNQGGNVTASTTKEATPPTPGNSGTITTTNPTKTTVELAWTKATDAVSAQSALEYQIYYSTVDNIDTVGNAEANGTIANIWTANISTANVTNLLPGTTYYFNVMVRDEAGNKAMYTSLSHTTEDLTIFATTDYPNIEIYNYNGTSQSELIDDLNTDPQGHYYVGAITKSSTKLFWTPSIPAADLGSFNRLIRSADVDGSNPATILTLDSNVDVFALDYSETASKLYYAVDGEINRCDSDGSNTENVITAAGDIRAMCVSDTYLFWSDSAVTQTLYRANLDGTGQIAIALNNGIMASAYGLGVDHDNSKIYYGTDIGRVFRMDFDGNNEELFVNPTSSYYVGRYSSLKILDGIVVFNYKSSSPTNRVYVYNLNGVKLGSNTYFTSSTGAIYGLVID